MVEALFRDGYMRLPADPDVRKWAVQARPAAEAAAKDPTNAKWLRADGTWFVGVDCLPNDGDGRVGDGPPLPPSLMAILKSLGWSADDRLHPAQVSVIYPGYPRPDPGETAAASGFRRTRDGAHLDGLLPVGPERRRYLKEPHAWILGLPLIHTSANASPLVVWKGSHEVMRTAFQNAFVTRAASEWANIDVTEIYQTARRDVFATCTRVPLPARPGEATLVHRLSIHGVAPWPDDLDAPARMIAYFRPLTDFRTWLTAP